MAIKQSRLHLPRAPARPGEAPDFSYVHLSPAGAVPRPDVNARARDIGFLSLELVRVLDDAGTAVGPWHPHLDPGELQIGLRHMVLTRVFDDRMQRNQRAGKISFYIRSLGEEAVVGRAVHGRCGPSTCCSLRIATRGCKSHGAFRWSIS